MYRKPEVLVMDAGRGQSVYFRLPGNGGVLVDAGSSWSGREISSHLTTRGVDSVETVIFTHPDRAHIEGYSFLSEKYSPKQIIVSTSDMSHDIYSDLTPDPLHVEAGDQFQKGGWRIEVLHPPETTSFRSADDRSLVLRFTHQFKSILVLGGAGADVQKTIVDRGSEISSTILLAGHPRRGPLFEPEFLDSVSPQITVFAGRGFEGVNEQRKRAESIVNLSGIRVLRVPDGGVLDLQPQKRTILSVRK